MFSFLSSAEQGVMNFLKPVGNAAVNIGKQVGHVATIVPNEARTVFDEATGNKQAAQNAFNQAGTGIKDVVNVAQSIPRGVVQLRQSAAHVIDPNNPTTGDVTPPASGFGHFLLGSAPIPTLQHEFQQVKQQTGSPAQATSNTLLSFIGDVAGAKGSVKVSHEVGQDAVQLAKNATPLNEVGAIGKITPDDLNKLSKATSTNDVAKALDGKVDPGIIKQIAPAIVETKDPGVIDNILTRATNPKPVNTSAPPPIVSDIRPAEKPTEAAKPDAAAGQKSLEDMANRSANADEFHQKLLQTSEDPAIRAAMEKSGATDIRDLYNKSRPDQEKLTNPEIQKAVDRATQPVNTGTFNVDENAKNFKGVAQDVRTAYSGEKNAQNQAASVLADTLKKAAPDEQGAIYWYRDQGGNIENLRQLADNPDPRLDPYREDIQKAMDLSPEAKQVSAALDTVYERAGKNAVDQGTLKQVLKDYGNTRLYQQEDKPRGIGATLSQSTGAAKQRVYSSAADAILNGKKLATTNASDVAAVHLSDLARANSTRNLLDNMKASGIGNWVKPDEIPTGWERVGSSLRNGQEVFVAPADLARRVEAITNPNLLARIPSWQKTTAYQGLVKTVDLSLSLFHAITFVAQALTNTKFGTEVLRNGTQFLDKINSPEFADNENLFYHAGGVTTKAHALQDITRNLSGAGTKSILGKVQDFPIAKQFLQLTDHVTSALFDKGQRWLKVTDFTNKFENYLAKHPEATNEELTKVAQGYAKEVNATYGGLNWEAMGISKTMQGVLRLTLLAPDWVISNISLAKYAVSDSGVGGHAARAQLFNALTTGMVSTQVLNKAITGHYTNENPKGHEFDVQLAPNVYFSFFRGGPGEIVKLFQNMQDNGIAQGTARYLQGKANVLPRLAIGLGSGTQFTGQPINNPNDNFAQKIGDEAKYIAQGALPVPFGVSGAAKYINNAKKNNEPINPLVAASLGTGVSRFSKTSNGLSTHQQQVIQALTKQGAPKEELNAVNSFYLTAKSAATGRSKVNAAIDKALANNDEAKAHQLANDYNQKYAQAFKGWVKKYGTYGNAGLIKAYNSHKINLTTDSINARLKSIKDNTSLSQVTTGG